MLRAMSEDRVQRGVVVSVGLALCFALSCDRKPEAAASSSAASAHADPAPPDPKATASDPAAWRADIKKLCDLPNASAAALQRTLGIAETIAGPRAYAVGTSYAKCSYQGARPDLTLEIDIDVRDLTGVRSTLDKMVGPTKDYPGFGDEGYSVSIEVARNTITSLGVRKGKVMMQMTSGVPAEKMRAALTALFGDMGISM